MARRRRTEEEQWRIGDLRRMTGAQIGALFGVRQQTVSAWASRGPSAGRVPRNGDGTYDARSVIAWCLERAEERALLEGEGPGSEGLEEFRRHRAAIMKLNLEERRGELAPTAEVEQHWLRVLGYFKAALLALPGAVAGRLEGAAAGVIENVLAKRLEGMLAELVSKYEESTDES